MPFTDHKITAFKHKIADLADQPNLPSNELKARFDSSPEELRLAHNNLCDDAARLDARVSGIITETFTDAIPETMLTTELADKINAKADETSVAERFEAETTARETGDTELTAKINSVKSALDQRVNVHCATYTGDDTTSRSILLPTSPKVIIVASANFRVVAVIPQGGDAVDEYDKPIMRLSGSKLRINSIFFNNSGKTYTWISFT